MNSSEISAKLQSVFNDVFLDDVVVSPTLTASQVEEWDSLTHVSLVLAVEEAFGIRFRVGEVEATKNVGELTELIERRLRENSCSTHFVL
jgi:acyl carrier protein